ncbi:MAG: thioredoxin fold domain-containing protein [Gammaproteobacteria bacterium]|nr:thioredoxin fold domain-containing protein [Gammaproteobacteria bacterium]MCW8959036.1 thioredoxin fold domain-containing protein [Gammaproteobacteria bacterium]MCW8973204.1 thioredoxin fold domain-containing protein [Gammaproteobacteria bacterium]MCW8993949.1 thioredoxin fold domain-containing protein [Gammaproteobacteria bacterium]
MKRQLSLSLLLLLVLPLALNAQTGEEWDELYFDDTQLENSARYPDWFLLSFLNLQEELQTAVAEEKRGLIVYLGQEYCPYCKALLEGNFGRPDIERYTRRHFEVVPVDIHGQKIVTDLQGRAMTERDYASRERVNFTPTLIFYDADGEEALRLQGYHPPYQFLAALEYVADGHYREEALADYLRRASPLLAFEMGGLNGEDFFLPPPHALDRSRFAAQQPLVVFFEQGDCHACDVLHSAPLQGAQLRALLEQFEAVQLDINSETPVLTPRGRRLTSRQWAGELGLFYAPTLMFFDRQGHEILRVDSVAGFYRLRKVLEYVLAGAYREGITLPRFKR